MRTTVASIGLVIAALALPACARAQAANAQPTTAPAGGALPHVRVDVKARQVRVDAETLGVDAPLEFFCVASGTNEHESVIRTPARPSHVHLALVMIGLEPGSPVRYSEATRSWLPPHGPPLQITMEYEQDGQPMRVPAYRWMRDIRSKKPMPPLTWIFSGSRVMEDGNYAADVTGYIVSVVNFDLTLIDIPELASSANESLQWERNPEATPPAGTKVTMLIEPAGAGDPRKPTTAPATAPTTALDASSLTDTAADDAMIARLRQRWDNAVTPHGAALREAAQTHYEVINQLRREQLRIINEADKVQRLIDELEKSYQDLTTPRPEPVEGAGEGVRG
ncbi:MAG TPA: YdjY domain-containing protein [Tepidisphaeraceae bacterium]|nr:YdjY domain-containing protein [Tepidisphaeraceae bacterium]